jgi:endonuclease-3
MSPRKRRALFDRLRAANPEPKSELEYGSPYQLLVAVVLSAQATDKSVNLASAKLFPRAGTPQAIVALGEERLAEAIRTIGLFRTKAKNVVALSRLLLERHGGEVPNERAALEALPGVGRKTANVVLGHALGVPGLPVDRHVLRVSNRIGVAAGDDPVLVEQQLCAALPPPKWIVASDTFILHGRRICKPRPLCDKCSVREDCDYYRAAMGAVAGSRFAGARVRKAAGPQVRGSAGPQVRESAVRKSAVRKSAVHKTIEPASPSRPENTPALKRARAAKPRGQVVGVGPHDKSK